MINLTDYLRTFQTVVERGSFTAAAKDLRVTPAWAARQVTKLEHNLQSTLLIRTTLRLHLTNAGHLCYRTAKRISSELGALEEKIHNDTSKVSGLVRLNLPSIYAFSRLPHLGTELQSKYPNLILQIEVSDDFVGLLDDNADIIIRATHELHDSSATVRKLGKVPRVLCASQDYLSSAPSLATIDDIECHNALIFSGLRRSNQWFIASDCEQRWVSPIPSMRANNSFLLKAAAINGQGVAFLPQMIVQDELQSGSLIQIAHLKDAAPLNLFALRPPIANPPTRIQIVWNHLVHGSASMTPAPKGV